MTILLVFIQILALSLLLSSVDNKYLWGSLSPDESSLILQYDFPATMETKGEKTVSQISSQYLNNSMIESDYTERDSTSFDKNLKEIDNENYSEENKIDQIKNSYSDFLFYDYPNIEENIVDVPFEKNDHINSNMDNNFNNNNNSGNPSEINTNFYPLEETITNSIIGENNNLESVPKQNILSEKMLNNWKDENEKVVIINFDDNWKSQYENALPILDEYGFKATFYVVCDYVDGKNRMSWEEVIALQNQGHEIGSHTMSHENLDSLPAGLQEYQIIESKKCLEDRGLKVKSFSYPFNSGDEDSGVLNLVANNYEFARTAGGSDVFNEYHEDLLYQIIGWSHDAEKKENNYNDLQMFQRFKEYVNGDETKKYTSKNIPIVIYHKIDNSNELYSTNPELFKAEMEYLYKNGFKVVTMEKIFG